MKAKDVLLTVVAAIAVMMFASCSETENGNVEFIPYQETADGQWGMISLDGKVLFSEEFKNKPTVVRDERFFVRTKEGVWEMYEATEKPKKIGADYAHTSGFRNGVALVAEKNKPVSIIDTEGKSVKLLDKIEGKMLAAYKITADGVMGVTTKSTPQEVVKMSVKMETAYGTDEHPAGTPWWYNDEDDVTLTNDAEGVNGIVIVDFSGNLSRQTYRTKRVIDYYGYYYNYYHDEHIPTGDVWNKVTPRAFSLVIGNNGRMKGKLRDLYKLLSEKFKKMGSVVKENNSAMVVELKGDKRAIITMDKDHVSAVWGSGLKSAKEIGIDKFKDMVEEDDASNISYGYLNDLFPDKAPIEEIADTAVVDTAAAY